ncbi:hypothetical protein K2Z83_05005 [Oscillochloris sp. ZM17-4]|nr:hypothetical protein [Oscillochloris sp. ZM17-4]MBX0327041.1 hypothetical protein [Oscillochloris sp. ZM17-4]
MLIVRIPTEQAQINCRLQIADCRLLIVRIPTEQAQMNCRLQIVDC